MSHASSVIQSQRLQFSSSHLRQVAPIFLCLMPSFQIQKFWLLPTRSVLEVSLCLLLNTRTLRLCFSPQWLLLLIYSISPSSSFLTPRLLSFDHHQLYGGHVLAAYLRTLQQ